MEARIGGLLEINTRLYNTYLMTRNHSPRNLEGNNLFGRKCYLDKPCGYDQSYVMKRIYLLLVEERKRNIQEFETYVSNVMKANDCLSL